MSEVEKLAKIKIELLEVPREMPQDSGRSGVRPSTAAGSGFLLNRALSALLRTRMRRPLASRTPSPTPSPTRTTNESPISSGRNIGASRENRMAIAHNRSLQSPPPRGLPPPSQREIRTEPINRRQAHSRDLDQERFERTLRNNQRVRTQEHIEPMSRPQGVIQQGTSQPREQNQNLSLRNIDSNLRMGAQGAGKATIRGESLGNQVNTGEALRASDRIEGVQFNNPAPASGNSYGEDYFMKNANRFREHGR